VNQFFIHCFVLKFINAPFPHFASFAKSQQLFHIFIPAAIHLTVFLALILLSKLIQNIVLDILHFANSVDYTHIFILNQNSIKIRSPIPIYFAFAVIFITSLNFVPTVSKLDVITVTVIIVLFHFNVYFALPVIHHHFRKSHSQK
jgi:hypothetical protein